nr:hypothetical protein [Tanacetum cinerariifolium]
VSGVSGAKTRVHIPALGESEAHNKLPDSIISNEPKPLLQHRPPPPQSVWSPGGGMRSGGGSGDASGAVHLARRSPTVGGDSKASSDDGVQLTSSDAVISNLTPALVTEANMLGERVVESKMDVTSSTTLLLLIASMKTASEIPIVQINGSANVKIKVVCTHTV